MTTAEIIAENPISTYELKEELEKIKKRDKELNFRAARTEEYLSQTASFKKATELHEKLVKLNIPRLKENHIKKIIDIMPMTVNDLKVVLQGYTVSVNNDGMKKIVDTISKLH
jgi:DNA-directed RNA polymerase subunit F|tara:strand:+ start:402 stop:740 length:339 start_codon:yes stop_codon:yes gene_type:complete